MPVLCRITFNEMIKRILTAGLLILHFLLPAQNYDAGLISQVTDITVRNDKLVKTFYYEIRINNRRGEKYTNVSIPYTRTDRISKIEAYIKDKNQVIIKRLKMNEISERSAISDFSLYEDDFVKEFTLKHNIYPYTLVYSWQLTQDEFLFIDNWIPVLGYDIPTYQATLNVLTPLDCKILYSNHLVDPPETDTVDGEVKYTWTTKYTDIVKPEVYSPPIENFLPSVTIVPQNFKYEIKGSFKSWTDFGNWQNKLLQGLNELPGDEKKKILALIKNIDDTTEKIKVLYHYLQDDTRYVNIKIETGGLKPYPASYVSKNKYGDCKALTNYFKSVMDFIGVKAYYTKVYAGNPIKKVNESFPSQQFNHIILFIPLPSDTIWLDCTSDYAFDYLGTFTQNRDAFVVDENNSRFVHTPPLSCQDVRETRKINILYDPRQGAIVKFNNIYKGEYYEMLLGLENSFSEPEKTRIMRNYIVENGFELIDYKISKSNRDSSDVELSYEAASGNIFKNYGNELLVKNIPFSLPHFEKPGNRKLPVQIDYPVCKTDTLVYQIPDGYKLQEVPDSTTFSNNFGQYSLQFSKQDRTITVVKNLLIKSGYYPLSEYNDFYKFVNKIHNIENRIYLTLVK